MDNTKKQYGKEADIFKALSHPTRILILYSIKEKQHTVSALAEKAEIDISTMSKHLDLLKKNKIILGEKIKNTVFYKINIPCIFNFLECANAITSCSIDCGEEKCSNIKRILKD